MIASLPDPVFVLTESGRYAALIGGRDRSTYHDGSCLVDFSLYDVLPRDRAFWFHEQIRLTLHDNRLRIIEYVLSEDEIDRLSVGGGPSGEQWFEGRISPMPSRVEGERAVLWVASNVSKRHELEIALQRLTETDELTGVYNRRWLLKALDDRVQTAATQTADGQESVFSLLIVDIDHFKQINDTYGHLAGDQVLKKFAAVCMELIESDSLFARMGGEEFALILAASTPSAALAAAERLRKAIAAHVFELSCGTRVSIAVSIGISTMQPAYRRTDDLIGAADDALYEAKKSGRNSVAHRGPDTDIKDAAPSTITR